MSDTPKTVSAKILRDFTDAGTERRFTAGKVETVTEGEFANFAAGGLVGVPDAAAQAATAETATPAATPETTPNKRG